MVPYNNKHCSVMGRQGNWRWLHQSISEIQVRAARHSLSSVQNHNSIQDDPSAMATLSASTIEQLVNSYFNIHAPLFPALSRADFLTTSPSGATACLWTICGVAAATCRVPPYVLRTIKQNFALASKDVDVLEKSTLAISTSTSHLF